MNRAGQAYPWQAQHVCTDSAHSDCGLQASCMWLIYTLIVVLVIGFHAALIVVIKLGLQQDPTVESPTAKNKPKLHFPIGFPQVLLLWP